MLRRLRRRGDKTDPVRRNEAVPCPLRHDRDHPFRQRNGLRPLVGHQVQHRRAFDDLHDLVAVRVPFPRAFAGEFGREDAAVAVIREPREGAFAGRFRGLRGAALKRAQLAEFAFQVLDRKHGLLLPGRLRVAHCGAEFGMRSSTVSPRLVRDRALYIARTRDAALATAFSEAVTMSLSIPTPCSARSKPSSPLLPIWT